MSLARQLSPVFVTVWIANAVFMVSSTMFFLLPQHLRALGAQEAGIGAIMGSFSLASVIGVPIVGALGDRFGRRPFLVGGFALATLGAAGFPFVDAPGALPVALRVLQGLGVAGGFVSCMTMVAETAPRDRIAQGLGLLGVSALASHAVGPLLAEVVLAAADFATLAWVATAIGAVSVALALRVPETRPAPAPGPGSPAAPAGGAGPLALWRTALRPGLRRLLAAAFLSSIGFSAVVIFLPDFAPLRGLSRVSHFFVTYTAASIGARVLLGDLADRVGHRRVALPTFALYAVAVALIPPIAAPWHLWLVGLLFGFAHGLCYPALMTLGVSFAAPHERGRVMSVCNVSFTAGVAVWGFFGGALADRFGYDAMFLAAAALTAAGALVLRPAAESALAPAASPVDAG